MHIRRMIYAYTQGGVDDCINSHDTPDDELMMMMMMKKKKASEVAERYAFRLSSVTRAFCT